MGGRFGEGGKVRARCPIGAALLVAMVLLVASSASLGGAKATVRPSLRTDTDADALGCNEATWNNSHLLVGLGSCQAALWGQYEKNTTAIPNETNGYNFSFAIDWVGEFSPSGQLVRLASPLAPVSGRANVTVRGDIVSLTTSQLLNVTDASGGWAPNDTFYGTGPPWNVSNTTIGTAEFSMGIHLNVSQFAAANSTGNGSSSLKFDVGVSGWPWVSSSDELGFVLGSLGAWGSHFTYNSTTGTLAEQWNATNRTFISVVFGDAANATYPTGPGATASVSEQAGLFNAGIPDRQAVVLVAFGGLPGNYSQVAYDPWVVLSLLPTYSLPGPPPPSSQGSGGWIVAAAVIVLVAGLAGIAGQVVRARRLEREGEQLVRDMRAAIGSPPELPGRPR